MFDLLHQTLVELRRLNSNLEQHLRQEKIMSVATDNLAAAVQRAVGLDQQMLAQVHMLVTQNQSLVDQLKAAATANDNPAVQLLADQINANSDGIAHALSPPPPPQVNDAPTPPAPAAPITEQQAPAPAE